MNTEDVIALLLSEQSIDRERLAYVVTALYATALRGSPATLNERLLAAALYRIMSERLNADAA